MNTIYKPCKYLLLCGLPGILVICVAGNHYYPETVAFSWIFVIALSGLVGIGTNTIAIRMLFRPQHPTVFGRQGLIPKNKDRIADMIGEQIEQKLLNTDTLMLSLEKDRVVEQTISTIMRTIDNYLSEETNRKRIADVILQIYTEYADRLFISGAEVADKYLSDLIAGQISVECLWEEVKPKIIAFFGSEALRHKVAGWIITFLSDNLPDISQQVEDILNRYFDTLPWWKKMGVKYVSGFNRETVARIVEEAISDPGTQREIVRLIEGNLGVLDDYLEKKEVKEKVARVHAWLKEHLVHIAAEKAVPALQEKIDEFLRKEESWRIIDAYLRAILSTLLGRLEQYCQDPSNVEKIKALVKVLLEKFHIKRIVADKIKQQDTNEFERMIVSVSGENLAAIEVLGGVLGMLAGIAVKEPAFLFVLPGAIFLFVGIERSFSRRN
ncbi:MAG: DUF445 family protein [Deltaproteobacteria bacterium]|nr:DUF445 family protein [Deltaproteobacteria bacterium]